MTSRLKEALETVGGSVSYRTWLYHQLQDGLGHHILDIGSGLGELPRLFGAEGGRAIIVSDVDDEMLAHLRRLYAATAQYRVTRLCIGDRCASDLLQLEPIDTITCVNVLEHIRCDRAALMNMHRMLARHGKLLLIVPALPCMFGTLDQAVGHYRRYTPHNLNNKLRQAGFSVETQRYMNFFGLFTWWLAGRVLRCQKFHVGACRLLDRLVPWLERLERVWAPPIGQSLVTICRKAGDAAQLRAPIKKTAGRSSCRLKVEGSRHLPRTLSLEP